MLGIITTLYFLATAVSLIIALIFWKNRTAGDWAWPSFIIAVSAAIWAFGQGMELAVPTLEAKIAWGQMQYLGIVWISPAWFILTVQRTNGRSWLTPRFYLTLFIIPIITLPIVFTNQWHGLIWSSVTLDEAFVFPVLKTTYGGWFVFQSLYAAGLYIVGSAILVGSHGRHSKIYRQQNFLLLIALIIPLFSIFLRAIGIPFFTHVDITPLLLTVGVSIIAIFALMFKLLDIAPVARLMILNNLHVGIIIISRQNQIIEVNPAAHAMLGVSDMDDVAMAGMDVKKLQEYLPELAPVCAAGAIVRQEIQANVSGNLRHYDIEISMMKDERGEENGRILTLTDITERKTAEAAMQEGERRYRLLADNVTDIIWTLNTNLGVTYISPSITRHLGYSVAEALAQTVEQRMPPSSVAKIMPILTDAMIAMKARTADELRQMSYTVEVENYCKGGGTITVDVRMSFLLDQDGEPLGILGSSRNITKQKVAETAVRETERRYRLLAENSTDVIWTMDMNMHITYMSPSIERHLGYSPKEMKSIPFNEIMTPVSLTRLFEQFSGILETKESVSVEIEQYHKDGRLVPMEINMIVLRDENGIPTELLGSSRNITERKKAELAIQQQNDFLNIIIDSLANPFYVIDVKDYSIQIANKAARALGVHTMNTCYALTHRRDTPCDSFEHPCPLMTLRKTTKPVTVEHIHFDANNKPRNMEVHAYPIFNDAGEVVQMIEYSLDITERKKAEAQFRQLSRAVEQSGSSIIITNLDGEVEFVNPAFTRTVGYTPEEIIGQNPRILQSGQHPPEFYQTMWAVLMQGKTWHGEMVNKKKDGTLYWEHAIISPITDTSGATTGYLAIKDDISDRKQAEAQIRQLSRAVEQSGSSIVITNADGIIEFVNPAFCRTTGYTVEEAVGQNPRVLKSGEHDTAFYAQMWETLTQGQVWQGEMLNRKKDGTLYWEHATISPVRDANGNTTHYVAIKDDITDRKRSNAETTLLLSMSDTIHNAPDYYTALDAATTLTGEYAGWVFGEVWIPDDKQERLINSHVYYNRRSDDAALNAFKQASASFTFAQNEGLPGRIWVSHQAEWYRNISNEPIDTYHRATLAKNAGLGAALGVPVLADGKLLAVAVFYMAEPSEEDERVMKVITAVAAQLGTALQQKMAQAALVENERQLRRLTDNISDLIAQTDVAGVFEYVSPSWTRILGYTEEELLGKPFFDLLHPDDKSEILSLFTEAMNNGETHIVEFRCRRADGSYLDVSVNGTILQDENGNFIGSVFGATDITERKRAETETRLLLSVSNAVHSASDFNSALEATIVLTGELTGWILGEAWILNEDQTQMINSGIFYCRQKDRARLSEFIQISKDLAIKPDLGLLGRIWVTKQREWIKDARFESADVYNRANLARRAGLSATLGVPIMAGDKVLAIAVFYMSKISAEDERLADVVTAVAAQLGVSLQQKQAQKALAENEYQLRRLTDNINDIILQADRYGVLEYVSPSCTRSLGYTYEEVLGESVFNYMPADDAKRVTKAVFKAIRTGEPIQVEFRFRHKEGHYIHMGANGSPLMDNNGKLSGTVFGATDITGRKQAEQKLQIAYKGIEKKVAELTAVNTLIQEMSRTTNLQDALNLVSRTMAEQLGSFQCGITLLNEEKTGMVVAAQYTTKPDHPDPTGAFFPLEGNTYTRRVFDTGKPVYMPNAQTSPDVESFTRQVMREQGIGSTLLLPLLARGEVIGSIGVDSELPDRAFNDEEIRLAETIAAQIANAIATARLLSEQKKAQQAAEDANKAKSTFLANMSHELRTPMNAILGFAQLMKRDEDVTAVQTERLQTIGRSGEHLLELINDILEMSKIEAGRIELSETAFDLHKLLNDVTMLLTGKAEEKSLSLGVDYPIDLPKFIRADEPKLRQVLINLIGNAIKFTNEGGVMLTVQHSTSKQEPLLRTTDTGFLQHQTYTLVFTIADSGSGIDVDELENIFDPFIQAKSKHGQQGTGLGLPISRRFVQMMGGNMYARNKIDGGAVFTFDIQASSAAAGDVTMTEQPRRVIGVADGQKSYRILLVEDDETNRALLTQLLEPIGFEVRGAENGRVAISHAARWKPDIILMDMRMPLMGGLEATHHIKEKQPHIPIIALTAGAFEHDRNAALAAGCDDFMTKPINMPVLFQLLKKYGGVQFVYDDEVTADEQAVTDIPLSADDLTAVSPTLRHDLHTAIITADRRRATVLIDKIRVENGRLADRLDTLLKTFQFDQLAQLTE